MSTAKSEEKQTELNAWGPIDQQIQSLNAKLFSGLSPVSLALAQLDWALNLIQTPSKQFKLQQSAWNNFSRFIWESLTPPTDSKTEGHSSSKNDPRFSDPAWSNFPWNGMVKAQHLGEQWWKDATQVRGMRQHSVDQMHFYADKWLDMVSPSNWLMTNPQAIQTAIHTQGKSLLKGTDQAVQDWLKAHAKQSIAQTTPHMKPGDGLAMTPGEIVARSHLCELIQYKPSTVKVHAEPVLMVPSCIMKYYILDLSATNSMVKWLVSQGHTVYMVSWRNPDDDDALLTMDDYIEEGVLASIEHVFQAHQEKIHLMGYCLGGTFAAMAAAAIANKSLDLKPSNKTKTDTTNPLASLTLLAAETDFTEPGEMGVLIDEAQVRMLEDMMASQGFLSGQQMAGSFQFLHSRELVWSNRSKRWLMGEEDTPNDLMTWNTDVTRLPAVMHSQYLRQCFLNNDLANGHFKFDGQTLLLRNIDVPCYAVGTVKDHVSPWRSVYKIHELVSGPVTFVLTNGGHNAGIISEPGHQGRHFQARTTLSNQPRLTADDWLEHANENEGSWWTHWSSWLIEHGSKRHVTARQPIHSTQWGSAPGQYVKVCYAD